jgi:hypothetical protein
MAPLKHLPKICRPDPRYKPKIVDLTLEKQGEDCTKENVSETYKHHISEKTKKQKNVREELDNNQIYQDIRSQDKWE